MKRLIDAHRITRRQLWETRQRVTDDVDSLTRLTNALRSAVQIPKQNLQKKCCLEVMKPVASSLLTINNLEMQMIQVVYQPFIPCDALKPMNTSRPCLGCGLELPARICGKINKRRTQVSPAYITHCLTRCTKYLGLGLLVNCDICRMSFLTRKSFASHVSKNHLVKPAWMPQKTFNHTRYGVPSLTQFISCLGCDKKFAKNSTGRECRHPFEYYVHCIEKCEKYKELNLISDCFECKLKFVTPRCLQNHKNLYHPLGEEYRRNWMSGVLVKKCSMNMICNTTVNCPGCDEQFQAKQTRKQIYNRLDYLVHCIDECEEYKKLGLIRQCEKCNCKFLNNLGLLQHRSRCIKK